MKVIANEISAKHFDFDKQFGDFCAEASDLMGHDFFSQVWDDAADCGFELVSVKDPSKKVIYIYNRCEDEDGDVKCWVFGPHNPRKGMERAFITIFND